MRKTAPKQGIISKSQIIPKVNWTFDDITYTVRAARKIAFNLQSTFRSIIRNTSS